MGSPTYPLSKVVLLARSLGSRRITTTAETTAREELGLSREQVYDLVAHLTEKDFYKTMESHQKPGLYQDVYRPTVRTTLHPKWIRVYCKVQLVRSGLVLVVISCKAR